MLGKPSEAQRRAMLVVRQTPTAAPLLDFLHEEQGRVLGALMTVADETALRRLQGQAQFIHDLLSTIGKVE